MPVAAAAAAAAAVVMMSLVAREGEGEGEITTKCDAFIPHQPHETLKTQ